MSARAATSFREADLKRAFAAARKAGVRQYRVDIQPNGVISVVIGGKATAPAANSCDDLLD